jgi:uncharacterized membrane protein (DUF485 family)
MQIKENQTQRPAIPAQIREPATTRRLGRDGSRRAVQGQCRANTGEDGTMAAQDYDAIQRNAKYQKLVRARSSFGWTLSAITLIIYFGFILLIGYAPKVLGIPIGGSVMTIGLPIGLFVIVSAFVLVGIYVYRANSTYDGLIRDVIEETRA